MSNPSPYIVLDSAAEDSTLIQSESQDTTMQSNNELNASQTDKTTEESYENVLEPPVQSKIESDAQQSEETLTCRDFVNASSEISSKSQLANDELISVKNCSLENSHKTDELEKKENAPHVSKNCMEEKKDFSINKTASSLQIEDDDLNQISSNENKNEQSGPDVYTISTDVEKELIDSKGDEKGVEINKEQITSVDEKNLIEPNDKFELLVSEFVHSDNSKICVPGNIAVSFDIDEVNKAGDTLLDEEAKTEKALQQLENRHLLSDNISTTEEKEISTLGSEVVSCNTSETHELENSLSLKNEATDDVINPDIKDPSLETQIKETTLEMVSKTSDTKLDGSSKVSGIPENEEAVSEKLTRNKKDDSMEIDDVSSEGTGLKSIIKEEEIEELVNDIEKDISRNSSVKAKDFVEMETDDEVIKTDESSEPEQSSDLPKMEANEIINNEKSSQSEESTKDHTDMVRENNNRSQSAKSEENNKMEIDEVKNTDQISKPSKSEVMKVSQNHKSYNTLNKSDNSSDNPNNLKESSSSSSSDDSGDELLYRNNFKELIQSFSDKKEQLKKLYFPDKKGTVGDAEIICLEDDDDDDDDDVKIILKPAAAVNCINPDCMSGENLAKPALFVLNHFKLKRSKGQQVCEECFDLVAEHVSTLGNMLINKEPLIQAEFPNYRDVILLDSDEEKDSDNESNLSDDTMSMIRDNIDDVIAEGMDKVDFNRQVRESAFILNNKFDHLQEEAKELDERFNSVQRKLDEFRGEIYKHFTQPIQELQEVNLSDCEIPPMPLVRDRVKLKQYNQQLVQSLRRYEQQQREEEEKARHQAYAQKNAANNESPGYESEVVALQSQERCEPPPNLPPHGALVRPKLKVGDRVYTMKVSYFSAWVPAKVLEVIPRNPSETDSSTESYRIKFEEFKKVKTVTGVYLAYSRPPNVQMKVGTRVIAVFKDEDSEVNCIDNYYVGVIAEPPKSMNKYRYLVFFDDGYTQYCPHENVLVVVEANPNVWEDIHIEPRAFIKNYLMQYPERPMVKLNKGQVVKVEWNGKWWIVRVLEVDASLVKVHFNADNRTEWIYRGSTRLGPMYQELAAAKGRRSGIRSTGSSVNKANKAQPYVEYTRGDSEEKKEEDNSDEPVPVRSVARKSTAKKPPEPIVANVPYTKPLVSQLPQGRVSQRLFRKALRPLAFRPHQCNRLCVSWTDYSVDAAKKYDPLVKPIMFGFQRKLVNVRGRLVIAYGSPCGRTVRNLQEMICYLNGTKSLLTIDLFDFETWVNPASEFKEATTFCRIEDLSYGKESVPISCVNELDHSMPQYVEYLTARNPTKGVNLNLDPEFLVGCDCKGDCSDQESCSCWQMTLEGKSYLPDGDLDPVFGYQYRRLSERVATGIYECNSRCGCSASCQNRVAQQPLSCRLQLFKTLKKGWGIRCLHDIPRGTFICIYAGFLLTDQEANEGGKTYGDEYLAELDYIESVEGLKQGYESEAREMSDLEEDEEDDLDGRKKREMKDEGFSQRQVIASSDGDYSNDGDNSNDGEDNKPRGDIRLRLRRRNLEESEKAAKKGKNGEAISISDEETETTSRKPQTFDANITKTDSDEENEYPSVRDLYGPDEKVFIMDAKTHGNIGRYLNHSCSPNVFVQNVFVDTHDLRFPWVAFFASQYIPAGQELTWDYNYDVGSVPGKVMHCYCGSSNCRGRLL